MPAFLLYCAPNAMRRLETAVREQKAIKAEGDKELVNRCNKHIKTYQSKYDEFSNITGIEKEHKRMSVSKVPNSVKTVDFSGNGGIMKLSAEHGEINSFQGTKEDVGAVQREAERIKNKLGISRVNLDGLKNADVLEVFVDETERLQNQYGKKYSGIVVSQNLSGTRIICEVNPSLQLCINADYFNDKQHLDKTLAAMLKNKYIP